MAEWLNLILQLSLLAGRARNMTLTSDLDIIFVYQAQNDPVSDGQIQIGATGYALKLAQRIINFLSTHTAQGSLYETDLRLRPDGNGTISGAL